MGIILSDRGSRDHLWAINYWSWHPVVEVVRLLDILPQETAKNLHTSCCGYGLTEEEAQQVADALETHVLPRIALNDRVLLDGSITKDPDDNVMHTDPATDWKNYSTSLTVLKEFVLFCRSCSGFDVR
jgi:hypothetical protein